MLTPENLGKISAVFTSRMAMRPLTSWLPVNEAAEPESIFQLQRFDIRNYYFLPSMPGFNSYLPVPHGKYMFVILTTSPGQIYCGAPWDSWAASQQFIPPVSNHAALAGTLKVLFAGELEFSRGELIQWSNNSGHFMPDVRDLFSNTLPVVRRLLPLERFREIM